MSDPIAASVLKFINGSNNSRSYLMQMYDYITDATKTDNGELVATQGCSAKHPIEDIIMNKRLYNKTHGKQGEHFVISFPGDCLGKSPTDVLKVVKDIVGTVYPQNIAVIVVHTDSRYLHAHVLLDSVNAVTGRKFSQSPSDLNRIKQKVNDILMQHGFKIIKASANEFVDHTDYSNYEGFDFLELDESKLITEETIEEISRYTENICIDSCDQLFSGYDVFDSITNYFGGYYMNNNNYMPYVPQQTMSAPDLSPETALVPQLPQEQAVYEPTVTAVPTAIEPPVNSYPNTGISTGPIFHIKGDRNSNLAGLSELVQQTADYAQKHQRDTVNVAIAIQQYVQQHGYQSNVSVNAGPIFDIDLTGDKDSTDGIYPPLPE